MAGLLAVGLALVPASAVAETSIERAARTGELSLGVYRRHPALRQSAANGDLEGYAIDVAGLIAEAGVRLPRQTGEGGE